MFKLQIRHPETFESRNYFCKSFEIRPSSWGNTNDVILYGTRDMEIQFPNRSDAGQVIRTTSYVMVDNVD